jgi:mannosyltransferase
MAQRASGSDVMRHQRPPHRAASPSPREYRRTSSRPAGGSANHVRAVAPNLEEETVVLPPFVPLPRPDPDLIPFTASADRAARSADRAARAEAERSGGDRQHAMAQLAWVLPTLVAGALGLIRIGWPALWADELATWGMVTIPWEREWQVLQHTDATLGAYYGLMHAWVSVLGDSDVLLRLPSVLAMAAAAGLTARIGTRLASPRVGLLSGLVFAMLPTTSRYGQEARPYALVVFAAVLSSLALARLLDGPRRRTLAVYALAIALLGLLHVIALLLVPAHALVVLAVRRSLFPSWLVAAGIGMLPALPVLYLGSQQTAQVSWIQAPTSSSLTAFPAVLLGTAVGAGMVLALAMSAVSTRHPAVLYASWALTPLIGLFVVSQVTALWLPRYLLFTAPAWALLAGTALGQARLVRGVAGLAVLAAVGISAHVGLREADAHLQATREAAALISSRMKPGDAIVYGSGDRGAGVYGTSDRVGRDLVAHYVPADRRPADVLQVVPQRTAGRVTAVECTNVARCLRNRKRVWVLRLGNQTDPLQNLGGTKGTVLRNGYYVSSAWYPRGLTVALVLPKPTG